MNKQRLQQILDGLPNAPGVYLMKSPRGRIVYVGKAKNLRARVRQYFAPRTSDTRFFVTGLSRKIADIEVVLTATEKEALLLEHNLIQRHTPRYNIRLRDDKNFLSLRLDPQQDWPRLAMVRRPKRDGASYYGPYHSAKAARATLRLVNRHFKLRSCTERAFANRARPCLQHQIRRCLAPCTLPVDREAYERQVRYVQLFLEGRRDDLLDELRDRMEEAAGALEYEQAALLRDQIAAVEQTLARQRITEFTDIDQEIIGLHREGDQVQLALLDVRAGRLSDRLEFAFGGQEFPDEELLSSFLVQRYSEALRLPDEIVVPRPLPDAAVLAELLTERRGRKVRVLFPRRGKRVDQLRMADENARQLFESRSREETAIAERLEAVRRKLHLDTAPRQLECVDIAHLGGTGTVGAISVLVDGKLAPRRARTYRLRGVAGGDDYGAIAQLLERRFRRALAGDPGWEAPDLLVVDGGRGQLARAAAVLDELGMPEQAVVAIAKQRAGRAEAATDRIFLPGRKNPIAVRADTSPLFLVARARDEAHRLANAFQARRKLKRTIRSTLDDIPGVGPKTRRALLRALGSVKRIREASLDELTAVPGVGPALAATIKSALQGPESAADDAP